MHGPARRIAEAAVLAVLVAIGASIAAPPDALDPPIDCVPAILVDGRLACGDEAAAAVSEACPGVPLALDDGDAVRTEDACARGVERMDPDTLRALGVVIDVQSASVHDLQSLPGVGPVLAQRIVEGRPYASADALLHVRGIGPATLARIRPRVRVGVQPTAQ